MAVIAFTSYEQLRSLITPRRATELFDDDGDGAVTGDDLARAEAVIAAANDEVVSILFKKGFSLDQLTELAADASLARYATQIAAQYAGERRSEFLNSEGKGPYDAQGTRARASLRDMSAGLLRSRIEDTAGENPVVGGEVSTGTPVFIVSRNPNEPGSQGPGGF